MPEIFRTRDLIVLVKGASLTVSADAALVGGGWPGGQGAMWADSPKDEFLVTYGDGVRGAGFALWGSDEDADKFTGITEHQIAYGFITIGAGSWIILTSSFERFTLASGRTVPITYTEGDKLLWSLRGLFTNEDEWTVSADPRAPNEFYVGHVAQAPVANATSTTFLGVQTTL